MCTSFKRENKILKEMREKKKKQMRKEKKNE